MNIEIKNIEEQNQKNDTIVDNKKINTSIDDANNLSDEFESKNKGLNNPDLEKEIYELDKKVDIVKWLTKGIEKDEFTWFSEVKESKDSLEIDKIISKIYNDFPEYIFKLEWIINNLQNEYSKREINLTNNISGFESFYKIFSEIDNNKKIVDKVDFLKWINYIWWVFPNDVDKISNYDFCKDWNDILNIINSGLIYEEDIDILLNINIKDTEKIVSLINDEFSYNSDNMFILSSYLPEYFTVYEESLKDWNILSDKIFTNISYLNAMLWDDHEKMIPLYNEFNNLSTDDEKWKFLESVMQWDKYWELYNDNIDQYNNFCTIITVLYNELDSYNSKNYEHVINMFNNLTKFENIVKEKIMEEIEDKWFKCNEFDTPILKDYKNNIGYNIQGFKNDYKKAAYSSIISVSNNSSWPIEGSQELSETNSTDIKDKLNNMKSLDNSAKRLLLNHMDKDWNLDIKWSIDLWNWWWKVTASSDDKFTYINSLWYKLEFHKDLGGIDWDNFFNILDKVLFLDKTWVTAMWDEFKKMIDYTSSRSAHLESLWYDVSKISISGKDNFISDWTEMGQLLTFFKDIWLLESDSENDSNQVAMKWEMFLVNARNMWILNAWNHFVASDFWQLLEQKAKTI